MGFTEILPRDFTCAPFSLVGEKLLLSATDVRGTNVMTVAWGGFGVMWGDPVAFFAVRPSRYTYALAEGGERFSLMALCEGCEAALAYCGAHSGREGDKLSAAALTPLILPSGAFGVDEARLVFDLKKVYSHPLSPAEFWTDGAVRKWYEKGDFHKLYFASVEKIYQKETSTELF